MTRPLRVMHVLFRFGVGGMEVGIAKLVNALDPAIIQSSICSSCQADSLKQRPQVATNEEWLTRAGIAGRRRAERLFGLDGMIREYERMYLDLGGRAARAVPEARAHEV